MYGTCYKLLTFLCVELPSKTFHRIPYGIMGILNSRPQGTRRDFHTADWMYVLRLYVLPAYTYVGVKTAMFI